MAQPTVIQGPAYINRGTFWIYTEGDIALDYKRETWEPKGSIQGSLGPRIKSTNVEISFTPVGEAEGLSSYWQWAPADIGGSILAATALSIIPKTGNKI